MSSFKLICVGLSDTQSCSIRPSCWGPGKQWVVMIMNVVLFLLVKNQSLCQYMWCCMQDSCVWRIYQGIAHIIRNITILLGTLSNNNIYIYVDDFKVQQSKTSKLMVHLKASAPLSHHQEKCWVSRHSKTIKPSYHIRYNCKHFYFTYFILVYSLSRKFLKHIKTWLNVAVHESNSVQTTSQYIFTIWGFW